MLRDYECVPWSDLVADRRTEIAAGWLRFLDGLPLPAPALSDGEGEVAGITYRIRGTGHPLVLTPLDLAPAQWEPLIAELAPHYPTITLGGPLVGVIARLESRGRSNYLAVIRTTSDGSNEPTAGSKHSGNLAGGGSAAHLVEYKPFEPVGCDVG